MLVRGARIGYGSRDTGYGLVRKIYIRTDRIQLELLMQVWLHLKTDTA